MTSCSSTGPARENLGLAPSLGVLLVRLVLGCIFIYYGGQHGFGLFGGHGIHLFADTYKFNHFPVLPALVWAWMSAGVEFFGGMLLIIGALSRLICIPLLIDMFVALWLQRAGGFGSYDFNLALLAMLSLVLLAGPGMIAVDALLFRRCLWSCGPQPIQKSQNSSGR